MRKQPTEAERQKILDLFLDGNGVNHTLFHLDYVFDADDVNYVIREELRRLRATEEWVKVRGHALMQEGATAERVRCVKVVESFQDPDGESYYGAQNRLIRQIAEAIKGV